MGGIDATVLYTALLKQNRNYPKHRDQSKTGENYAT
jgi:hypothetical protein